MRIHLRAHLLLSPFLGLLAGARALPNPDASDLALRETNLPTSEGKLPFTHNGESYETYYKIFGSLDNGVPLVTLHGGPGSAHYYLLSLTDLASSNRAVIFYDQLGCGNSTHLRDKPSSFWTPELFMAELANLLNGLSVVGKYDLLGQSWGGMLAAQFASTYSDKTVLSGLRKLIIHSSPASMELFDESVSKLVKQLPEDTQETIKKNLEAGTTDSQEYQDALLVFYRNYTCRIWPFPDDVLQSLAAQQDDPTVYDAMNGPSELETTGSLHNWTIIPSIPSITAPTLLLSGKYDEVQPEALQPFFDGIPHVDSWVIFDNSSHLAHLEQREKYMSVVKEFLEK